MQDIFSEECKVHITTIVTGRDVRKTIPKKTSGESLVRNQPGGPPWTFDLFAGSLTGDGNFTEAYV
jgi:hypothetical protein